MTDTFLLEYIAIEEQRLTALKALLNRQTGAAQVAPAGDIDFHFRDDSTARAQAAQLDKPVAQSVGDMATPKQFGLMRALARGAQVDLDAVCQGQTLCAPEELTKRAASELIDYLKTLPQAEARRA